MKCINWSEVKPTKSDIFFIDSVCNKQDINLVKKYLKKGQSINTLSYQNCALSTVIYSIAGQFNQKDESHKSIKFIEELLKLGANPNWKSCTPYSNDIPPEGLNSDNIFSLYIENYSEDNFNKIWLLLIKYKGNPDLFASEILKSACSNLNFSVIRNIVNKADIKKYNYLKRLNSEYNMYGENIQRKRIDFKNDYKEIVQLLESKGAHPIDSNYEEPPSLPLKLMTMKLQD